MPRFTLAAPEEKIIISWLFEPNGYLDYAVRAADGISAREALVADPELDVTQWMRDNEFDEPEMYECGMIWWIRNKNGVNITPPTRPPETPDWIATLEYWDSTIQAGFDRASQAGRDSNTVNIYDESCYGEGCEIAETMPAGAQLAHQQSLINKVLGVLQ